MQTPPLPGDRVLVPLGHHMFPAVVQYLTKRHDGLWVSVRIEMDGPDVTVGNQYLVEEIEPIAAA